MSMAFHRPTTGCFTCETDSTETGERNAMETIHSAFVANIRVSNKVSNIPVERPRGDLLANIEELDDGVPSANTEIITPPSTGVVTPTTSESASPLGALFFHDQPLHVDPLPQRAHPANDTLSDPSLPLSLISNLVSPGTESDDVRTHAEEDLEGTISVIRRDPILDRTAESNALPFVLQGYATWISRLALDPLKLRSIARDFVFSQFEDGDQSRWVIALLANIGSRIGRAELVDADSNPMISALHTAVRRRLGVVKSRHNPTRLELISTLDASFETIAMHFYADSPMEAMALRYEAAPIFRQLCPEPPNAPINLPSLLENPVGCLRQYAGMSVIFSVLSDTPTLFRFEVPIPGNQSSNLYPSLLGTQEDGIVQWLYGIPNQIILLFAKIKELQQDGLAPNGETVASLERDIHEIPPFTGSSSDRFLAVMRSVVQECWRQAAFVYLYMVVGGDTSDTPRVKDAFKRFMKLLNGTRPGRLPDEFVTSPLILISPAAQRSRDRDVIRQRAVGLHRRGRTFLTNDSILCVIEDYWARADAERRPVVWSDLAVSRGRVLGI
ncbi:hypothetical protein B0J17DRAFT_702920 [Rhizoctonia solani]|nr:hypothetical protein B0J17DRAFT_702920 [Rhizoctonia solani]